jgi:hypothetical protein
VNPTKKIKSLLGLDGAEIRFLEQYIPHIEAAINDPKPKSKNFALTPEFLQKQKDRLKYLKEYK